MPQPDSRRREAARDDRVARRPRARTGVVIIDDDISWQVSDRPARGGRRTRGPVAPGRSISADSGAAADSASESVDDALARWIADGPSEAEPPAARRTVVVTGRPADRHAPARRGGYESALRRHHRAGFQPDRVAMWAVMLGILLVVIAATSGHA